MHVHVPYDVRYGLAAICSSESAVGSRVGVSFRLGLLNPLGVSHSNIFPKRNALQCECPVWSAFLARGLSPTSDSLFTGIYHDPRSTQTSTFSSTTSVTSNILLSKGYRGCLKSTMTDNSPAAQMGVAGASSSLGREVDSKEIDFINNKRHKLIPKKQQNKISVIENWPDVHPEMELPELIAARGSLMETLKSIKPGNSFYRFIGLLNDADAACNDAWAVATTLRGLVTSAPEMPSYGTNEPGLSCLLDYCAIREIEKAVKKLTCVLLAPSNVEILGSISTRISLLKSTVERVEQYMGEVRSWKCIGDKLIKGMNEGNEQFIRGVLDALEACYVGGKDREDTVDLKSYLIATGTSTRRMRRHHATDTTMEGLGQEATPVSCSIKDCNSLVLTQHLLIDCASHRQEKPPIVAHY